MLPLPDSAGRREVLLLSVVRARRPKGKAAGALDVGFAKSPRTPATFEKVDENFHSASTLLLPQSTAPGRQAPPYSFPDWRSFP